MIWVEAITAWMHWLPVSKAQFESRWRDEPACRRGADRYDHMLALNPRIAPARIGMENYLNALLTGVLPSEAQRFAARLGEGFAVPTLEQWLRAWAALDAQPAERHLPALLPPNLAESVRFLTVRLETALAAAGGRRRRRTLADQMLMRRGVLEWVEQEGALGAWVGIGEPPGFTGTRRISPERGPVVPYGPEGFRSYLFGFRLIRTPRRSGSPIR